MPWILLPFAVQALLMTADEFRFHHRRGLPRWERLGHPLDTATVLACYGTTLALPPTPFNLKLYAGLALFSCLFVTKDEFVHARRCSAAEQWVHAVLFVLHPLVLGTAALLWYWGVRWPLIGQTAMTALFGGYQLVYWNWLRSGNETDNAPASAAGVVNNAIYDTLGDRWYDADDDPVALLRAESRLHNTWIVECLRERVGPGARVLDIGCGAGYLTNQLAQQGFDVTGLDASQESLNVAARHDATGRVSYEHGDALALPYPDASFDAVCSLDFLEHVEEPARVVAEAARVLRPGGVFFFHTFNRNWLAWLVVIKGVEWFVKNTPKDLHVLRLFVKPEELESLCKKSGLVPVELRGSEPVVLRAAFWKMLATGIVPRDFEFRFTRSTRISYIGFAERA